MSKSSVDIAQQYIDGGVIPNVLGANSPGNHSSKHLQTGTDPIPYATTSMGGLMSPVHVTNINQVEETIRLKADKGYVDNLVSSVASGSPKGVYATLAALQAAFPTGNTNTYIVNTDNNWYYWNGSAWTAGGLYQSSGLAEGSVTPDKTSFLIPERINYVNKDAMAQGYVDTSNGSIIYHAGAFTSDFIPVTPGAAYSTNGTWTGGYYDASKNYVTEVPFRGENMVVPLNAGIAFVRIGFDAALQYNIAMYVKGPSLPSSYVPYDDYDIGLTEKFRKAINQNSGLYNLKWNAMGDSITEPANAYHYQIAQRTGVIVRNYGISGTHITTAFSNQGMAERYVNMDDDADIITVFGGTNDFGNGATIGALGDTTGLTLYGAMKILIEGLLTKYPGKRIGFILPTPREGQTAPDSSLKNYVNVIKEMCDRYSIPTLDLYTGSGLAPDFPAGKAAVIPDGLHPNEPGQILISHKIESFLLGI